MNRIEELIFGLKCYWLFLGLPSCMLFLPIIVMHNYGYWGDNGWWFYGLLFFGIWLSVSIEIAKGWGWLRKKEAKK